MSRPIVLKTKHALGIEQAKQRLNERFEKLRAEWLDKIGNAQMVWSGDTATVSAKVLGQKAGAKIEVAESDMTISIELPFILVPFGGAIVAFLKGNADALEPDPKP